MKRIDRVRDKPVVEPIRDLLDLRGSLKTDIKVTSSQIRKAFEKKSAQKRSPQYQ